MTVNTICQSSYVLNICTRETFIAQVDDNNNQILVNAIDLTSRRVDQLDADFLNNLTLVYPVVPVVDDVVVSFDEDELITGVVEYVYPPVPGGVKAYGISFGDSDDIITLERKDFHVVGLAPVDSSADDFKIDEKVCAINDVIGFKSGMTGVVQQIYVDSADLLIVNPLGISYINGCHNFRSVDYTTPDVRLRRLQYHHTRLGASGFETVVDVAEDSYGIDISVEDAIHLGLMSEDDAAESEVDVDAETDKAVEDSSKAFEDFFQTIFNNIFGVAPKDAEAQRQANIDTVERAMHREIDSSTKYISDANTELEQKLQSAQVGLSIQMNLIGRVMASPSTPQTLQDSLQNIMAGLAVCRNDVSDALRCSLDRDVETYISETSLGMMADQVEELQQ
jgi:hypothetical protein